jgi:ATP-dependent DNA helicase RecG
MTEAEFRAKLDELRGLPTETEWVEFKQNDRGDPMYEEIGEYLSAIANSCAILRRDRGYIAWGVENGTHALVGTDFRPRRAKYRNAQELENWLTYNLSPQTPFGIHEQDLGRQHFVIFEVGTATHVPVSFRGERYIRVGSAKTKLRERPEKERLLWSRLAPAGQQDWSAQPVEGATLADLDTAAITFARAQYKIKFPKLAAEVDGWDAATFLNKAKVCIGGKVTRAAVVLLGKNEAEPLLSPAIARITWVLKDVPGTGKAYEHFGPPLILAVDQVFAEIRNLTYRHLSGTSLFPTEFTQYDTWVIREALHNCIAHQDYTLGGKITVVEKDDELLFTSLGDFLPGTVEAVICRDGPPEFYRNRFLTEAMFNLNMIDTIGSGVRRMFTTQRDRHFPMPDYDLSEPGRVKVRVIGKVLDEKYTRILIGRPDLDLLDVIGLDKVQKGKELTEAEFRSLKGKKLIEGRRPNLFVSAVVAAVTDTKADYIRKRAFDKGHYKKMVVAYLEKFGEANREDIDKLLLSKLSDALTPGQKANFIKNLLQEMRREGTIRRVGAEAGPGAKWVLSTTGKQGTG